MVLKEFACFSIVVFCFPTVFLFVDWCFHSYAS